MSDESVNVNFSHMHKINNKAMRLSKLQKWILTNAYEIEFEAGKYFYSMVKGFEPKAYYVIEREQILHSYPWKIRQQYGSAEVVLTRSLRTMEKYGLIKRVHFFRERLDKFVTMWYALKTDKS